MTLPSGGLLPSRNGYIKAPSSGTRFDLSILDGHFPLYAFPGQFLDFPDMFLKLLEAIGQAPHLFRQFPLPECHIVRFLLGQPPLPSDPAILRFQLDCAPEIFIYCAASERADIWVPKRNGP